MSTNFDSSNPLSYTGLNLVANPQTIAMDRAPLSTDWQSFNPGDMWRDTSQNPPITYVLASVAGDAAVWQPLVSSSGIVTINSIGPNLGDFGINQGSNITITPGVNSISIASTGGGNVDSVTGTVNQIDVTPTTGDCVVSIDPSYSGQTSITTLGTVATGTWNGTLVEGQYGGTGVANTGRTINLGSPTTGYVLTSDVNGNGSWQAAPKGSGFTSIFRQVFTSSGIYIPSTGTVSCDVEVCGGGGAGSGSFITGTGGGTTSLGVLISATGGGGGIPQGPGGAGGVGIGGDINCVGGSGGSNAPSAVSMGGNSFFGGGGANIGYLGAGGAGGSYGGGGSGSSGGVPGNGGSGGGGGYSRKIFPVATITGLTITIGAGGTTGSGCGAGASGVCIITEYIS